MRGGRVDGVEVWSSPVAAICSARRANCAAAREGVVESAPAERRDPSARREGPAVELRDRWEGRWCPVLGPRSLPRQRSAVGRARRHRGDQRQREASRVPQLRPLRLPRAPAETMDSGLSSAYSSAYSSAQSSAYSSLANTPRNEPSQAELKDAARDHRLAPSGRDHLSAVQHGARLPRRHEKRNRELKGRPRVRRTGGGSGGSGGSGSGGSGSSRGSPAGSPLRRHGSVVKFDDSLDELFEFQDRPYHNLDRASWATPQYLSLIHI